MNEGMQEQRRKSENRFFCVVAFWSKGYLPHTSAGKCRLWKCVNWGKAQMRYYTQPTVQSFINMKAERKEAAAAATKRCFAGRWDNPPLKLRIKTTLKRRWMNRWISRWRMSSQRWITLKLLRRRSNLLTFIIIQLGGVDTHSITSRRCLN